MRHAPRHTIDDRATQNVVLARSALTRALRTRLHERGAVEVTTPSMSRMPDIAPMAQFRAAHPAFEGEWLLRIAPTESLKRLVAIGFPAVFELSVNFRGDAPDTTHLPEFASLEVMQIGADCAAMRTLTVDLLRTAVEAVRPHAERDVEVPDVREVTVDELLSATNLSTIAARDDHGRLVDASTGRPLASGALDGLVGEAVAAQPGLLFVTEFPWGLGGPAASCSHDPRVKERCELFLDGVEMANMSSTLTDQAALRRWHEDGVAAKAALGIVPNHLDEGLLEDLAALPASAVTGIGIERILTYALGLDDIRQVSLSHLLV
ncbi:MAG: amino acid--tRNA ligase-related protein [Solirubrobacteraceae bacterium]